MIIHGGMHFGDENDDRRPSSSSSSFAAPSNSYATYKTTSRWHPLSDVWSFDLVTLRWKEKILYPQLARSYHSIVGWGDGTIAAFGGFQQNNGIPGEVRRRFRHVVLFPFSCIAIPYLDPRSLIFADRRICIQRPHTEQAERDLLAEIGTAVRRANPAMARLVGTRRPSVHLQSPGAYRRVGSIRFHVHLGWSVSSSSRKIKVFHSLRSFSMQRIVSKSRRSLLPPASKQ